MSKDQHLIAEILIFLSCKNTFSQLQHPFPRQAHKIFSSCSDILNFTIFFHSLLSNSDFFERVMLTNSVIWQCSLTGRPDLTFSEAVASEKTARKLLRQFPSALRGPVILVASLTKRSGLRELVDDVFNNIKDRFFKNEKLDVMNENGRGCRFCKITDIILPENHE
jgi:ATP-utilising chromatin assembly and remodelling N-terminal